MWQGSLFCFCLGAFGSAPHVLSFECSLPVPDSVRQACGCTVRHTYEGLLTELQMREA